MGEPSSMQRGDDRQFCATSPCKPSVRAWEENHFLWFPSIASPAHVRTRSRESGTCVPDPRPAIPGRPERLNSPNLSGLRRTLHAHGLRLLIRPENTLSPPFVLSPSTSSGQAWRRKVEGQVPALFAGRIHKMIKESGHKHGLLPAPFDFAALRSGRTGFRAIYGLDQIVPRHS